MGNSAHLVVVTSACGQLKHLHLPALREVPVQHLPTEWAAEVPWCDAASVILVL